MEDGVRVGGKGRHSQGNVRKDSCQDSWDEGKLPDDKNVTDTVDALMSIHNCLYLVFSAFRILWL